MFCNNCGAQLNDDAKFCFCCGCQVNQPAEAVAQPAPQPVAQEANPYCQPEAPAQYAAPVEAPVAEPYTYQAPPAPQYTQPTPPPAPAYMPPTPEQQYQQPVYNAYPQNTVYNATPVGVKKNNPFCFIAAAIMALMFLFSVLPWATAYGEDVSLFMCFSEADILYYAELEGLIFCAIIMLVTIGMLIPGIVLALVKRAYMPAGFSITSSVLTFVNLTFFTIFITDVYRVEITPFPLVLFILAIANIVFTCLARKN